MNKSYFDFQPKFYMWVVTYIDPYTKKQRELGVFSSEEKTKAAAERAYKLGLGTQTFFVILIENLPSLQPRIAARGEINVKLVNSPKYETVLKYAGER